MFRVIARLDIKNNSVINTVCLEGLRVVGDPKELAYEYYESGADELYLNDLVASLYRRNSLFDLISDISQKVFIPITAVGGVRTLGDVEKILKSGADKVGINTAAVEMPRIVYDLAKEFGSQAINGCIDTRKIDGEYRIFTDGGRELHDINLREWINQLIDLGIGELVVTSIDRDGKRLGLDEDLINIISEIDNIPVTISGGIGNVEHYCLAYEHFLSGVAAAGAFHTAHFKPKEVKKVLSNKYGKKFING
jgi:cyclase